MEFFCALKCYTDYITGAVDFTSPLTKDKSDALENFLYIILPTVRVAQEKFALAAWGGWQIKEFFSDMLASNDRVAEFGQFLIRSHATVWGHLFFGNNEKLKRLVDPSIL